MLGQLLAKVFVVDSLHVSPVTMNWQLVSGESRPLPSDSWVGLSPAVTLCVG